MRARWGVLAAAAGLVLLLSGCTADRQPVTTKPVVAPPAIAVEGVLRVGVDESYPPFASKVGGSVVGLDVDVAAALAERLGLRLELVDVRPAAERNAFRDGRIDVALGGVPVTDSVLGGATFAGTYLTDGPALFTADATTASVDTLDGKRVAVQKDSAADRALTALPGRLDIVTVPTVREALEAVSAGKADVAAGDAVVAGYIARDMPAITYAGQLGDGSPLGVAVSDDATELETAVREAIDGMAAGGVIDAIRTKWVGGMSLPSVAASPGGVPDPGETTADSTGTVSP